MAWPNVYGLDVNRFHAGASNAPAKPTLLLVHDAFHSPAHFERLVPELVDAGFRVMRPQLPSAGSALHANPLDADVRMLITCGKAEIDHGRHVVILAHGYGAIPACMAANRLNEYSLDHTRAGEVKKLILIAGVILKAGESYRGVVEPDWIAVRDGLARVRRPDAIFFQDCSSESKSNAIAAVRPQVESSLRTAAPYAAWTRLPTLYIVCEQDNAITSRLQHDFARTLRASNRQATVVGMQAGHCPFISRPGDIANLVARASV